MIVSVKIPAVSDAELMRGMSRQSTGGDELNNTHFRFNFDRIFIGVYIA
jgi:hypothetical protein